MDLSEKSRFAEAMAGMAAIYNKEVTPVLVSIYWDSLKKYDFGAVGAAFKKHYQGENAAFWPKPGDLITLIEGNSEDRAIEAWHLVDKHVRITGHMESVVFPDPVIMATIEQMGGWVDFCMSPNEEDHKFKGERFKKAYRANLKKDNLDFPRKLIGMSEADSNFRGIKSTAKVALLGPPSECEKVMKLGRDKPKVVKTLMKMDSIDELTDMLGIEKKALEND